ncbi:MAG: PAS domain-containing protein [Parvibaculaceae bacterium]|nr:PAS domain-containing protein [Parvibaculaceae bacterium]
MATQIGVLTPTLQTFLESWKSVRDGEAVPKRAAIRPDIFPRQSLGYITYQEYEAPGVLVWKIAGTALVDALGMELTGSNALDLLPVDERDFDMMVIEAALAHPCGLIYAIASLSTYGEPAMHRLLQLPVRGADGAISRFVGMVEPYTLPENSPAIDLGEQSMRRGEGALVDIGFGIPDMNIVLGEWTKKHAMT